MGDSPQEIMAKLIEEKAFDMKARADLLMLDGQALCAKAETIRYEAMVLQNDLYKFKRSHPDLFPDEE